MVTDNNKCKTCTDAENCKDKANDVKDCGFYMKKTEPKLTAPERAEWHKRKQVKAVMRK